MVYFYPIINHLTDLKSLLRTLIILSLFLMAIKSFGQTGTHYLYVEIRGLSAQRGVPELTQQLHSIPAVDSVSYCENVGLAIIHTKTPAVDSRSDINRLLHSLNYHYVIKSDIPIEEARKICLKNTHH